MKKRRFNQQTQVNYVDTEKDSPAEEYKEKPGREYTILGDIVGIPLFITGFFSVAFFFMLPPEWQRMGIGAAVFFGGAYAFYRVQTVWNRVPVEYEHKQSWPKPEMLEEPEEPEEDPFEYSRNLVRIYLEDGRDVSFFQPEPGEFSSWIRLVVQDAEDDSVSLQNMVTLSQNRALGTRGWPKSLYDRMIHEFYQNGIVEEKRNGIPEPTPMGLRVFRNYLSKRSTLPPTG